MDTQNTIVPTDSFFDIEIVPSTPAFLPYENSHHSMQNEDAANDDCYENLYPPFT